MAGEMRRERKVVTVVVADLVGSTALIERLDPEEASQVVGGAVAAMVLTIEGFGGTVKDLAGDGVLALFGAPSAHEDDEERAVRAALAVVGAVATSAPSLQARVGVTTGLVVLGPVGAGSRVEYGATGDVVNVAARLQAAASPGEVLVGEATQRAAADLFVWSEGRVLELKGKDKPVRAYVAKAVRNALPWRRPRSTPHIGRDCELEALLRAISHRPASVVLVTGEPGAGKTRLIDEVQPAFEGSGWSHWIRLRGHSYEHDIPYGPLRRLFEEWLGVDWRASEPEALAAARSSFRNLFGPTGEDLDAVLGGADRLPGWQIASVSPPDVAHVVGMVLRHLLETAPVALIVDDLQWADTHTLALLAHLADGLRDTNVPLIAAGRPGAAVDELSRSLAGISGLRSERIHLSPLTPDDSSRLLRALAPDLAPEAADAALEAAAGNPQFITEIAATAAVGQSEVESSLERAVLARLDLLPALLREVVSATSVAGPFVEATQLAAVLGRDADVVADALTALQTDGLMEAERSGWRFRSPVVREVAYQALLRTDRASLHRRFAEVLGQSGDTDGSDTRHLTAADALEAGAPPVTRATT